MGYILMKSRSVLETGEICYLAQKRFSNCFPTTSWFCGTRMRPQWFVSLSIRCSSWLATRWAWNRQKNWIHIILLNDCFKNTLLFERGSPSRYSILSCIAILKPLQNLDILGRPKSRVIVIGKKKEECLKHPDNIITVDGINGINGLHAVVKVLKGLIIALGLGSCANIRWSIGCWPSTSIPAGLKGFRATVGKDKNRD